MKKTIGNLRKKANQVENQRQRERERKSMTSIKSTPEFELDNNGSATDGFEEISRCLCGSTYFIIIISSNSKDSKP